MKMPVYMLMIYIMWIEKSMLIGQLKHLQSFEAYGARFQVKERANGENSFIKNL